jgi:hypothetical protein
MLKYIKIFKGTPTRFDLIYTSRQNGEVVSMDVLDVFNYVTYLLLELRHFIIVWFFYIIVIVSVCWLFT